MKTPRAFCLRCLRLLPLAALFAVTPIRSGQHPAPDGFPDDWSHHHLVFSNPGTAEQAIRSGRYSEWLRTVSNPRYILQQQKRAAYAHAGASFPLLGPERATSSLPREPESPVEGDRIATRPIRGVTPAVKAENEANPADRRDRIPRRRRVYGRGLKTDWSKDLGTGASVGLGNYPAKFATNFSITQASCDSGMTPDYVVYNTGLAGSAGQASIVAFDNLYTGCTGTAPMYYWAYDTGGAIVTSVVLSPDGSQVAFVQSSAGAASLVILKWKVNHADSASAPEVLANTPASSYYSCMAPCMTTIPFKGGADDTGSSPFYIYGMYGAVDIIYVGDDAGNLHKFNNIFGTHVNNMPPPATGPTEQIDATWPIAINTSGEALSTPVLDDNSGNILVGDHLVSASPNCAMAGCGFLYSVNSSTGAFVKSARLDYIFGIVDAPLVDTAAGSVYVFVGADSGFENAASPCGVRVPCGGVFQLSTRFAAGAGGTEETIGNGYEFLYAGTFDNTFYTSANPFSPTGNLYVIGNTGAANNTLYQIPITSNVMGAANTGPQISTNFTNNQMVAGMPVSEIYTGTNDYIFTSALIYSGLGSCTSSPANGCVMGFDVTNAMNFNSGTAPTGATTATGGASAIIIDTTTNALAGTSNIYYSTLADQVCSDGTGGCAIQISQSSP